MQLRLIAVATLVSCAAPAPPPTATPTPGTGSADPWTAHAPPEPQPELQPELQPQPQPQPQPPPPRPPPPQPQPPAPPGQPTLVGCPSAASAAAAARRPRPNATLPGSESLHVWRSRDALPECLRAHVPADVNFKREMLAAWTPLNGSPVVIAAPDLPLVRAKGHIVIEKQAPPFECPPCRGIADREDRLNRVPIEPTPLILWRLPRVDNVDVFFRAKPHPSSQPCPPCLAS